MLSLQPKGPCCMHNEWQKDPCMKSGLVILNPPLYHRGPHTLAIPIRSFFLSLYPGCAKLALIKRLTARNILLSMTLSNHKQPWGAVAARIGQQFLCNPVERKWIHFCLLLFCTALQQFMSKCKNNSGVRQILCTSWQHMLSKTYDPATSKCKVKGSIIDACLLHLASNMTT